MDVADCRWFIYLIYCYELRPNESILSVQLFAFLMVDAFELVDGSSFCEIHSVNDMVLSIEERRTTVCVTSRKKQGME